MVISMFDRLKVEYMVFYLLWPIIIVPKQIQIVFIGFILFILLRRGKIYLDAISYFLIFYIVVYLISIVYNLVQYSYDTERTLATLNMLCIWVIALFFYLLYKSVQLELHEFNRIAFLNYSVLIGLWVISFLLSYLLGQDELRIFGKVLFYTEWFSGTDVLRFVGLMDYANLIVLFFMFFYPFFCMYANGFENKWLGRLVIVVGTLPIISTYSRSGYFIIMLGLLLFALAHVMSRLSIVVRGFVYCFVITTAILCIFYTNTIDYISMIFLEVYNAREGSNDSRTYLMAESIRVAMDRSPLIGMGIKTVSELGYPLGSHSTFVGFIYKTGIVGFIIGTAMFIVISVKLLFLKIGGLGNLVKYFMFVLPIIFLFEDLDGSNWLIVLYFVFLALLYN